MSDWRDHPPMEYEETYGFHRGRVEARDLRIYIGGPAREQYDYGTRMAAGLACPSCAEPFPAPCELASIRIWRAECPNLFAHEVLARSAERRIAMGCCPFCEIEVSPAAFNLLVSGMA